jgi:hypothetical protein
MLHLGGDETYVETFKDSGAVRDKSLWGEKGLVSFESRLENLLQSLQRSSSGRPGDGLGSVRATVRWHDAFGVNELRKCCFPPTRTIVEVWKGSGEYGHMDSKCNVTAQGLHVLVTDQSYLYLDRSFLRDWTKSYAYDVYRCGSQSNLNRGFPMPSEQRRLVLGGELGCWGGCMKEVLEGGAAALPWRNIFGYAEQLWSHRR